MNAEFLFNPEKDYTIQDAYVLGNLFSFNYIESTDKFEHKRASFMSKRKKPQATNSTGFEYNLESFESYKNNLIDFFKKDINYKDIDIKILWDDDIEHDGAFPKKRGERILYFNLDFDIPKDFSEILINVRYKIVTADLFIWFFRGIFDTRGSIDKTTKKIAVDMDRGKSYHQAREIEILSNKFFKDINLFTNYNPRSEQPSEISQKKNGQMRPNINFYFNKIGTINPQLIIYYLYIMSCDENAIISNENEYFIDLDFVSAPIQKIKLSELKNDDVKRKDNKILDNIKRKLSSNNKRRCLSTQDKLKIWTKNYNKKTLDGEEIDFVLIDWHHAIPNHLRNNDSFSKLHSFIDDEKNFIPLSSNSHTLIHKKDDKLNDKLLFNKYEILRKMFLKLDVDEYISIDDFIMIYK